LKASEWNKETRKLYCMETIKENYRLHQKKKSKYKGLHITPPSYSVIKACINIKDVIKWGFKRKGKLFDISSRNSYNNHSSTCVGSCDSKKFWLDKQTIPHLEDKLALPSNQKWREMECRYMTSHMVRTSV